MHLAQAQRVRGILAAARRVKGGAAVRHDPYAALRHRDFRWYVVSLFSMTLASQLQAVVVGGQVYQITRDPLA